MTPLDIISSSNRWLQENVKLNKVSSRVECHNMDARDFIRGHLPKVLGEASSVHVLMNLPALAVDFVDSFRDILSDDQSVSVAPVAHVYTFIKDAESEDDAKEEVRRKCRQKLFGEEETKHGLEVDVNFVRNVAPSKDMYRATFAVPVWVMKGEENACKRRKISSS